MSWRDASTHCFSVSSIFAFGKASGPLTQRGSHVYFSKTGNHDDAQLAQTLFELAIRIDRGEWVDIDAFCRQHPGWAKQFGSLIPILRRLAALRCPPPA